MATDTKTRPEQDTEESTVKVTSETEHDTHLIKELQEKAGDRIRKRLLTTKLSAKAREDMLKLAEELEGSVARLAKKSEGEALIEQVDKVLEKAEKYIEGVAEEEAKEEKEKTKAKKEAEEKEHKVHPHAGEKPASAEKTPQEKAKEKLDQFRAEIRAEAEEKKPDANSAASEPAATVASTTTATPTAVSTFERAIENNKRAQELKKEEEQYQKIAEMDPSKITGKEIPPKPGTETNKAIPLDQLHHEVASTKNAPDANTPSAPKTNSGATRMFTSSPTHTPPKQGVKPVLGEKPFGPKQQPQVARGSIAAPHSKPPSASTHSGAAQVRPSAPKPPKGKVKISAPGISKMAFMQRLMAGRAIEPETYETQDPDEIEEIRYPGVRPVNEEVWEEVGGEYADDDGDDSSSGQSDQGDQGDQDDHSRRRRRRRPKSRGGGRGGPRPPGANMFQRGSGSAAKTGGKVALQVAKTTIFRNPWVLVGLAVLAVVLFFIFVVFMDKEDGQDKCQAAAETMNVTVSGPPDNAAVGQSIPYQINVTDTVPNQEVTVTALVPQGISVSPPDITSSWPKFILTNNTITWKASENLPPNSLNPPNFNFTVTLKPTVPNANLVLKVDVVPQKAGAQNGGPAAGCAPGGGGTVGGPITGDWVAPSADACGGKYAANMRKNPTTKNFGDPTCNFTKDVLYTQLKTADPVNADVWFNKIVPCESGYNPNAYAGPQTGTPDAAGAWGLYQMGSSTPPGSAPPAEGKNGPNDRGDVPWNLQTANATAYGKKIGSLGRYWACAR